jgi:hypothetical protein
MSKMKKLKTCQGRMKIWSNWNSHFTGENIKLSNRFGKLLFYFQKANIYPIIQQSYLWVFNQEKQKHVCTNFICYNPNLEKIPTYINRCLGKPNVVVPYNRILLSHKKDQTIYMCKNMDLFKNH